MATLSNADIQIEAYSATQVKVTVTYRLTPSNLDKLAGAVFNEQIQLWGEDGATDDLRFTFSNGAYAVSNATPTVERSRVAFVSKTVMNEDPQEGSMGQEAIDEIYARVTVTYAANKPIGASDPTPANTSYLSGHWK